MADANTDLFNRMVNSGLDRGYAVAEKLAPEYPEHVIDVSLSLTSEQLETADWSDVASVEVRFIVTFDHTDGDGIGSVTVPATATAFEMEKKVRPLLDELSQ